MSPNHFVAVAIATSILASTVGAEAQSLRERPRQSATVGAERYEPGRGWGRRDIYSVPPGRQGIITATTPNESGNLGGPYTGGGGGGGP